MKRSLKTKLTTILLSLAMFFTMMPTSIKTVKAEDEAIELVVGAKYKFGDKIKVSQIVYISYNDIPRGLSPSYTYTVGNSVEWDNVNKIYLFPIFPSSEGVEKFNLSLGHNKGYTGSILEQQRITGFECVEGEGTKLNPYKFEITFNNEITGVELAKGVMYAKGENILLSKDTWILCNEDQGVSDGKRQIASGVYTVGDFTWFEDLYSCYTDFKVVPRGFASLNLGYDKGYTGSAEEKASIIGIKCIDGDGSEGNPFVFKLMFETDPTIIDEIKFTITPPVAGDEIEVPGDKESQTPRPVINIPDNAPFALNDNDIYWAADEENPFEGKFLDGQEYYVIMILKANEGYKFADEPSFDTNCDVPGYGHVADGRKLIQVYAKIKCQPNQTTHTVTYKIVNGTWSDGKNDPITEDVKEGETPSNIPTGMKPISDENLVGSWNTDPSKTSITRNTEFTYTFPASDAMVLSVTDYSGTYDGNSQGSSASATANVEGATIEYSTDDGKNWSTTVPTRTDVGTTEVKVKATAKGYVEKEATYQLTINPAPITIKTGSASKPYDGSPLTNDNATIEGLVNNETATVKATGSQTEVGSSSNTYSIDWGTTKASNYDITEILGKLTVSKNTTKITLTAASDSKTYDGKPLTNSNVTVTGLPLGFKVDNVTMTAESTITDVGIKDNVIESYVIRDSAGIDKTANFTNVTKVAGTLAIMRKSVTVRVDAKIKTFGDNDPKFTAEVPGLIQGDELTYTLSREDGEEAGKYKITATGKEDQGNYKVSYESGTLVIRPKSVTVKADDKTKAFGDKDPELTATVQGLLQGDELTYTLSREDGEEAGKYKITATGEEEQGNYEVFYEHGTLTIVAYTNEAGNNSSWTKGSTSTLDFRCARTPEISFDEYQRLLTSVEVDGQKTTEYEISKGSIIVKLKSSLLQDLAVGNHKLTINFNDGSVTANFTIKEKENNNNNNKTYNIPKTGVE